MENVNTNLHKVLIIRYDDTGRMIVQVGEGINLARFDTVPEHVIEWRLDLTDLGVDDIYFDENGDEVEEVGVCDMRLLEIDDEATDRVGFVTDEELDIAIRCSGRR